MSDATAGVTAKYLHPCVRHYVITKIIPPSTLELADKNGRVRGQFNKRLLIAYREAKEVDDRATERAVETSAK